MSLSDDDEQLHPLPRPLPGNWQENVFVILWAPQARAGFMVHVQRVPGRAVQEARMVAGIGAAQASATVTAPFAPDHLVPGLDLEVVEPFRCLRLRAAFDAADGPGPLGFIAAHPRGPVRVEVDVELRSELPPVDFAGALAELTAALRADAAGPQMGDQAHYEQGGTWRGRISVGGRAWDGAGSFVRDHSWGIRHEHNDFRAFWTATCLDDGAAFCNAIGMPTGDRVVGVGAYADAAGVRFTTDVGATFTPSPGLCTYDTVEVRYGAGVELVVRGDVQQHWPMYLPFSGRDRYDNNALCTVDAGGRRGFAVMEWAATLDPAQTALLDAAARG